MLHGVCVACCTACHSWMFCFRTVQIALFHSIKPLFAGKQLVVVASKQDIKKLSELSAADQAAVQSMIDGDTLLLPISNLTEEGIDTVKNIACDKLLEARVSSSASTPPSTQSDHICTLSLVLPVSPKQPVANDCARLSAALALTGGPKQWRPFVRATHNGTKIVAPQRDMSAESRRATTYSTFSPRKPSVACGAALFVVRCELSSLCRLSFVSLHCNVCCRLRPS